MLGCCRRSPERRSRPRPPFRTNFTRTNRSRSFSTSFGRVLPRASMGGRYGRAIRPTPAGPAAWKHGPMPSRGWCTERTGDAAYLFWAAGCSRTEFSCSFKATPKSLFILRWFPQSTGSRTERGWLTLVNWEKFSSANEWIASRWRWPSAEAHFRSTNSWLASSEESAWKMEQPFMKRSAARFRWRD